MKSFLGRVAVVGGLSAAMVFGASGIAAAEPMVSSWYGPGFNGAVTASGDVFHSWEYTAAHKTLPFGTKLLVSYGGESVVVEVTDRGPYVAGRSLDLSQAAAESIGITVVGEGVVDADVVSPDTPVGPTGAEVSYWQSH